MSTAAAGLHDCNGMRQRSPFNATEQQILEYESEYGQLSSNCMFDEEESEYHLNANPNIKCMTNFIRIFCIISWIIVGILICISFYRSGYY